MNGAAGGLENIWLKNILYELKYFKLYTECVFTDMYTYVRVHMYTRRGKGFPPYGSADL